MNGEHLVRSINEDNWGVEVSATHAQLSTEDVAKLREIHGWLSEIMPAARVAMKMLNARSALTARWRGGKNAQQ